MAVTAEYTDWTRAVQHPVNLRDMTAEALHDATLVAPITATAAHLSTEAHKTFFYVLNYDDDDRQIDMVNIC